jgi:AraC-like DNA-binding protein
VETLRTFIRRQFGQSPKKWMNDIRANESKQLLMLGKRSKEISYLLANSELLTFLFL